MYPYKNKCPHCKSPSNNMKNTILCSNSKCKTWKKIKAQMPEITRKYPSVIPSGDSFDDPIIIKCPKCHDDNLEFLSVSFICNNCAYFSGLPYEEKWYLCHFGNTYYSIKCVANKNQGFYLDWPGRIEYKNYFSGIYQSEQ